TAYRARGGTVKVLTGITQPARWPELSEERVADVVAAVRGWAGVTVLDTGFSVEADEELSSDVFAPRRNAATIAALRSADRIVLVGSADPVGISRLVRSHAELGELLPGVQPTVVVNRVAGKGAAPGQAYQVRSVLERFGGIVDPVLVPDDPRAFGRVALAGRGLADVAARSPARVAVRRLADVVLPPPPAPARRRRSWHVMVPFRHSWGGGPTVDWHRADAE
ncbi:MAG TPA: hypothetical protein VFQ96_07050, partial [Microbacteriaceae bacterium]|nr:hypothetical protein [Microbacteriaceae bacterium]